jgi:integrase
MAYLAAILGLRWRECARLRVGTIDVLGQTVTIDSQLTRRLKGRMVTRGPKWDSDRIISTPRVLLDLLAAHLRRRGVTGAGDEAFVFTGPEDEPLHYSNWQRRVWAPACERAGLSDLTFRALRTANRTAMMALAVDIKTSQTRAGHCTPGPPSASTLVQPKTPTAMLPIASAPTSSAG